MQEKLPGTDVLNVPAHSTAFDAVSDDIVRIVALLKRVKEYIWLAGYDIIATIVTSINDVLPSKTTSASALYL
jgi:hypothetical protein